tara:strand:+ start:106 stop:501 length:396 start_codon:yes stop_codon:yes gene_type:complete
MQVKFEDSGTPLKRSRNRKGETSGEQLRRMCKNIANEITNPVTSNDEQEDGSVEQHGGASEWMEGVYDIRYIVDREKRYYSAELLVAGGGPTIWVSLYEKEVQGYWGSDRVTVPFIDNLGLDEYCEEMYGH